ncbi:ABC-2 type transporter [Actinokineospora spheciospongiae]|uniref:Transport permease protein n=1 Tax=Actinokineospora spheciospongiae TaxID=909613 RepID=W7INU6_9PSEU|nr:ABC transporter permease [Actinokineospora spheciospongiae]EWC58226.1 ABC-2 type transporter [Actinokineospora spheciospongiae]PWW67012.1 ABC transporter DrrB family efflux protein [Actinokineospora spheciospongiae]
MTVLVRVARDSGTVAWRNLLNIRRTPGSIFASVLQPIMFVLLLGYVFGGSLGGDAYREFIMGGIFAQTVTFNASFTTIGLANDLQRGIVDRFRALPMSRVAVMLGRTTSDLTTSVVSLTVTSLCGLAIGWRIRGGILDAVLAYLLILLFAFAMSWVGAFIGLTARSVEVAQSLGLIWLFPATFISSGFVSVAAMPEPLATIAEWNPITALANAARSLFANPTPAGLLQPQAWPAQHAALYAALWSIGLVALFMSLSVARYRRVASR